MCVGRKQPKLDLLCRHFQVELTDAHDARADTRALAECVAEAWRRGVML
jgi:DNA polymerase III epsilon subunit-like protein